MESYNLIHGDCLQEMWKIDDQSVDMILCDLPYGTTTCAWDTVIPFDRLWAEYKRVAKENAAIVLFGSQPFTTDLIQSNRSWFRYCWVWDKRITGNPFLAEKQPLKIHEDIVVFCKSQPTYNPQMVKGRMRMKGGSSAGQMFDVQRTKSVNDLYYPLSIIDASNAVRGDHPTEKPVGLCEYLIRTYTNPGELVLDNCMGSGTTVLAALNEGRRAIGIELDPGYFALAKRRIETMQMPLLSTLSA